MFGAAKAEWNPPPAGTVQLHPALIITTPICIRHSAGQQSVCQGVSLCAHLCGQGHVCGASRAAVCLCARAVGATGQRAPAFSAVQQVSVCVCVLTAATHLLAAAAEWRAVLLGAELPVSRRCHSAGAASSRRHFCSSCVDGSAAVGDAYSYPGSWAAVHGLSHYHVHARTAPVNSNSTRPGWHPTNTCGRRFAAHMLRHAYHD